jgi:hypothetical protein
MKHYKTPDGEVWAFNADGSQDELIHPDMVPVSEAELEVLRAPKPGSNAKREARELESQLTLLMLAEAIVSGDTNPLKVLLSKIKAAKTKT